MCRIHFQQRGGRFAPTPTSVRFNITQSILGVAPAAFRLCAISTLALRQRPPHPIFSSFFFPFRMSYIYTPSSSFTRDFQKVIDAPALEIDILLLGKRDNGENRKKLTWHSATILTSHYKFLSIAAGSQKERGESQWWTYI